MVTLEPLGSYFVPIDKVSKALFFYRHGLPYLNISIVRLQQQASAAYYGVLLPYPEAYQPYPFQKNITRPRSLFPQRVRFNTADSKAAEA